jgi:plasmid stability protein
MPDILIRGVDRQSLARLKARAQRNGRSLQGEAKLILENAAGHTLPEALASAGRWRRKLAGHTKRFSNSADLIREDRQR